MLTFKASKEGGTLYNGVKALLRKCQDQPGVSFSKMSRIMHLLKPYKTI